jgi:alpha-ketoglutarate-dependent 2,4-dichlorophenoxyacetate dioxygenase
MTVKIAPISPGFGAEISGVDISQPLEEADANAILKAIDDYAVLVFRNTGLDDVSHVEFSRIFGHVETMPSFKKLFDSVRSAKGGKTAKEAGPHFVTFGNLTDEGRIVDDPERRKLLAGDRMWHTDSSFMAERAAYSALLAYVVPPSGGDTHFADMRGAWDRLPAAMKARIEGLEADHCVWWSRHISGADISEEQAMGMPAARHPLVHRHKSGRTALFLASHIREIPGLPLDEGRGLVAELTEHATQPDLTISVSWDVGDLVVWDNLATMHRATLFDDLKHRREMRRTTIRDGAPPETADDPYGAMYFGSIEKLGQLRGQPTS